MEYGRSRSQDRIRWSAKRSLKVVAGAASWNAGVGRNVGR
jgi:hypothetical protein